MRRFRLLSLLLMGMACGACLAEEVGLCKSFCATEKRQCRSTAQRLTEFDTLPGVLTMEDKNPLARNFEAPRAGSEQIQPGRTDAFRHRRMERMRLCEGTFNTCDKACATAPQPSILLKPDAKR